MNWQCLEDDLKTFSLSNFTSAVSDLEVTSIDDLDNIRSSGIWKINANPNIYINGIRGDMLICFAANNNTVTTQYLVSYDGHTHVRSYWHGTWYGWKMIYTNGNPPKPEEIGAVPTYRTVNGKSLSSDITLSAENVGAVSTNGGSMNGWLTFNGTCGPEWTTVDGTKFAVRPYSEGNLFQITTQPMGKDVQATFNIDNDGAIWFGDPEQVREGLGAAPASHTSDNSNPHNVTAEQVGAISTNGGTMYNWLTFSGTTGPEWNTADGTRFSVRPYYEGNLFQITTRPVGKSEQATFNINNDGSLWFGDPEQVRRDLGVLPKVMTQNTHYGSTLPASGSVGEVFFKTGDLDMMNYGIKNLATPISSQDAATKGYVDYSVYPVPGVTTTVEEGKLTVFIPRIGTLNGGLLILSGYNAVDGSMPFSLVAIMAWNATVLSYKQSGFGTDSYTFDGNAGSTGFTFTISSNKIASTDVFSARVRVI